MEAIGEYDGEILGLIRLLSLIGKVRSSENNGRIFGIYIKLVDLKA